jgi:hypothetical protein
MTKLELAFRKETMSRIQILKWMSKFKCGMTDMWILGGAGGGGGCSSKSKIDKNVTQIWKLVQENKWLTICKLANKMENLFGHTKTILTQNQTWRRLALNLCICQVTSRNIIGLMCVRTFRNHFRHTHILSNVITVEKPCVHWYDPETKQPFSQWKQPIFTALHPKKAREVHSTVKSLLNYFSAFTD